MFFQIHGHSHLAFFNNGARCLAVLTEPDSLHRRWLKGLPQAPLARWKFVSPMLAGFRLLFGAISLSISVLVLASGQRRCQFARAPRAMKMSCSDAVERDRPKSRRSGGDRRPVHLAPLGPGAIVKRRIFDTEPIQRERQHGGRHAGAATGHDRRIKRDASSGESRA